MLHLNGLGQFNLVPEMETWEHTCTLYQAWERRRQHVWGVRYWAALASQLVDVSNNVEHCIWLREPQCVLRHFHELVFLCAEPFCHNPRCFLGLPCEHTRPIINYIRNVSFLLLLPCWVKLDELGEVEIKEVRFRLTYLSGNVVV